jgi:hypothetical protein
MFYSAKKNVIATNLGACGAFLYLRVPFLLVDILSLMEGEVIFVLMQR